MTTQSLFNTSIFSPDAAKALEDGWLDEAVEAEAAGKPTEAATCLAEALSPGTIMSQPSKL
jgi:hypothetical protein